MKKPSQKQIIEILITILLISIVGIVIYYFFFYKQRPAPLHQPEFQLSEKQQKEIDRAVEQVATAEATQENLFAEQEKQLDKKINTKRNIDVRAYNQQQKNINQLQSSMNRQGAVLPGGRLDFNPQ